MTSVTEHQMFGDMKHDGVQGDVFRMIDAQQRGDNTKLHEAATATDQDVDALTKTYDFVFTQTYPDPLQAISQKTVGDRDSYVASARAVSDRIQHFPQDYHGALDAFTAAFDQFEHSQETLTEAIKAERDREAARGETLFMVSMAVTLISALTMAAAMTWASRFMLRGVVHPIERIAAALRRQPRRFHLVHVADRHGADELRGRGHLSAAATAPAGSIRRGLHPGAAAVLALCRLGALRLALRPGCIGQCRNGQRHRRCRRQDDRVDVRREDAPK
jgi:hypothetical protein